MSGPYFAVLKKQARPRVIGDGPVTCGSGAFNFLHALGFETAGKGLWVVGMLQGDIFSHDAVLYGLE